MAENKEYITRQESMGTIQISEDVVASISSSVALETEGVGGLLPFVKVWLALFPFTEAQRPSSKILFVLRAVPTQRSDLLDVFDVAILSSFFRRSV